MPQILAYSQRGGEAIHDRHLQVHQHHIEPVGLCAHGIHRFLTVVGNGDNRAFVLEQLGGNLLVVEVVLGEQDAQTLQARAACCGFNVFFGDAAGHKTRGTDR